MPIVRIAVANIRFPPTPEESVALASKAIEQAAVERADLICFPECYVPGYRGFGRVISGPSPTFLERAWATIAATAYRPSSYAEPSNSFHEKAIMCRAAENTCFLVTANCASEGSPTTSAVVKPDGTLLSYKPYNKEGLLIADIDLPEATGLLASRYKPAGP
jgi:predicted amidohydrolase